MSNSTLYQQIDNIPSGQSQTFERDDFRDLVDEQDRVMYMSVARKLAAEIKCDLAVAENTLTFSKNPKA